jgi:hypothetical protein
MRNWTSLLIAAPVAIGLLAAPAAHADWRHHGGGWDNGWHGHEHHGNGNAVAGELLGLGVGAVIGGVIASQQPYYYAPPPVAYAPPPAYYPQQYYAPPGYGYPTGY